VVALSVYPEKEIEKRTVIKKEKEKEKEFLILF
jgi:hypothetical protein